MYCEIREKNKNLRSHEDHDHHHHNLLQNVHDDQHQQFDQDTMDHQQLA